MQQVVAIACRHQTEVLFVQRAQGVLFPKTWSLPGGKVEKRESLKEAAIRELFEECSIALEEEKITYVDSWPMSHSHYCYQFTLYHADLISKPAIILSPREHIDYIWKSPSHALFMDLIPNGHRIIRDYLSYLNSIC